MTAHAAPAWCRWRRGRSAVLVIAPHGGRRDPQPVLRNTASARKVNDLHTVELAEELADALDAGLIANPTMDRNQLDLNRISQVAAHAPWFLSLMQRLLEEILSHHPRAEVLFVHGWNVIQPKCDIGVGLCFTDPGAVAAHAAALTISPRYAVDRLDRLRAACAREDILATFGERYPARHPNNLLQLFRRTTGGLVPGFPTRLDMGRIDAVQLELGVPLRWPGAHRRGFLRAATTAFMADGVQDRAPAARLHADRLAPPVALQLYDPGAGVGLTARVDVAGGREASRLLVFLGSTRLALYIGEDPHAGGPPTRGPHFAATGDGFDLHFAGTALTTDDGRLYWDLEQGFAASRLCTVRVDLRFRSGLSQDFGSAAGWVEVDGLRRSIAAPAFARHGILQRPGGVWASQLSLSAAFGTRRALRVRHEFPGAGSRVFDLTAHGEAERPLPPVQVCFGDDRYAPQRIAIGGADALACDPLTRMTITRPLAGLRHARVTFGAARFTRDGAEGYGFYEYGRVLG